MPVQTHNSTESTWQAEFCLYNIEPMRLDMAIGLALPNLGLRARRRLWETHCICVNAKRKNAGTQVKHADTVSIAQISANAQNKENPLVFQPFILKIQSDFYAIAKPAMLHSAHIAGKNSQSVGNMLPKLLEGVAAEPKATAYFESVVLLTRLDYETSGILLAANKSAEFFFRQQEALGKVSKKYLAVVSGKLAAPLLCTKKLNTDNRLTTKVENFDDPDPTRHTTAMPVHTWQTSIGEFTLLLVEIKKGARHQIRAHLADAGLPLLGDAKYGSSASLKDFFDTLNIQHNSSALPPFLLHHTSLLMENFTVEFLPDWYGIEKYFV